MKIKKESGKIDFDNLLLGELFEYEKVVYIRTKEVKVGSRLLNAVSLDSGILAVFSPDTKVLALDGELIVWEK